MTFEERITQAFRAYLKRKGFGDYPCLTFAYAEQGLEFPVNPGQTLVGRMLDPATGLQMWAWGDPERNLTNYFYA